MKSKKQTQKKKNKKKSKKRKKKKLFLVVLDKICVFCLYPIPDSQQYVKRGSCRRPILSGLLCLFSFWVLGPFVASFEFGPWTLSFSFCLFILSRLWVAFVLAVYVVCFVFNYYQSLNVMSCCFLSCLAFVLSYVKCLFLFI